VLKSKYAKVKIIQKLNMDNYQVTSGEGSEF
jgi:hypothetical protein